MKTDGKNPTFDKNGNEILRTPNPNCPACRLGLRHASFELRDFHPDAGKGIDNFGLRRKHGKTS
jgi:hypothetical protein